MDNSAATATTENFPVQDAKAEDLFALPVYSPSTDTTVPIEEEQELEIAAEAAQCPTAPSWNALLLQEPTEDPPALLPERSPTPPTRTIREEDLEDGSRSPTPVLEAPTVPTMLGPVRPNGDTRDGHLTRVSVVRLYAKSFTLTREFGAHYVICADCNARLLVAQPRGAFLIYTRHLFTHLPQKYHILACPNGYCAFTAMTKNVLTAHYHQLHGNWSDACNHNYYHETNYRLYQDLLASCRAAHRNELSNNPRGPRQAQFPKRL